MFKSLFNTLFFFVMLFVALVSVFGVSKVYSQSYERVENFYDAAKRVKEESFLVKKTKGKIVRDSSYISFFQNGNIKSKGQFRNNLPKGSWFYYYENGGMKAAGSFKDGVNVGVWRYYYENGSVSAEGSYDKGVKVGAWKYYFESENQVVKTEGDYVNNKREGLWKFYDETGLFKAQALLKQDSGKYTEYYPSGNKKSEGMLVNGKSAGLWQYFHDSGALMGQGQEKEGIKEGAWVFYDTNGAISSKGQYENGKQVGDWIYYHANGEVASNGVYRDDMKEGEWSTFNTAGKKIGQGNFINGKGIYKEYYESGKLKIEGPVENDKNEGQWNYYYESGELEGTCFYKQGKGKYLGYYKDSTRKMEGLLENGHKTGIWRLYKPNGELAGLYKTYYDKDAPVFEPLIADSVVYVKSDSIKPAEKPLLKIPKKKSRYFIPRVNEFKAYIVGVNPVALLRNSIPLSVEVYYQERLGYELGLIYDSKPMFRSHSNAKVNELTYRAYQGYLRQKFYQKDKDYGMLYFAHELRYTNTVYASNIIDTAFTPSRDVSLELREKTFEYSILFGDRIIQDSRKKGFTFDIFVGIGIGYRSQNKDWQDDNKQYKNTFSSVNSSTIKVPFRLGFTIGYIFPMAR